MQESPVWLQLVMRRFPANARTIAEMSARPGPFRDMCEELADAEAALAAADGAPPKIRDARRDEWRSAIESLTQEIDEALRASNVVRIDREPKATK